MSANARFFASLVALWLAALGSCRSGDPERGRALFREKGCDACHSVGGSDRQGPDLAGVAAKYSRERLRQWLRDPEAIYRQVGKKPINKGFPPMPRFPLTRQEIADLTAYLATLQGEDRTKAAGLAEAAAPENPQPAGLIPLGR